MLSNIDTATETSSSSISGWGVVSSSSSSSSSLSIPLREHFEDQKSLAAAYLLTMGAKALFYTEKEIEPLQAKESFKEEASIHMSMKIDEISASFFGKISSQRGMKIKKRGRNGKIRHIVMYMITNDTELEYIPETKSFYSNSCSLVYKSFWGTAKKFDLENINMLTLEAAAETTTSSSSSSLLSSSFDRISSIMGKGISSGSSSAFVGRNVSSSQQQRSHVNNLQSVGDSKSFTTYDDDKSVSNNSDCGYSTDNRIMMTSSKQSVTDSKMQTKRHQQQRQKNNDHHKNNVSGKLKSMMPYIRITNADRYIDLQFETLADHHGCLESLQKFCQTKYSQRDVAGMMGGLVITDD